MKRKHWICLMLAAMLLLSSCSTVTEDPKSTTTAQALPSHSLQDYTQWIGYPLQRALSDLDIQESTVAEVIPTSQKVDFMGMEFALSVLTEKAFDNCFSGIQLTATLDEGEGEVAPKLWALVMAVDDEYLSAETSYENVYTEAEIFTSMEEEDFQKNLETGLRTRGIYSFEVSWDITRMATEETKELLKKMGKMVLEETEAEFADSTIDFVWSADARLDVTVQADVLDKHKAEIAVTCKVVAEPAAGKDMDLDPSDRNRKFFRDSYQRLLQEKYLSISGYRFRTAEDTTALMLEEIILCGENFVQIQDNGVTQMVYLCTDGAQYTTVCRNGEYDPWQKLSENIEYPLPWAGTTVELVLGDEFGGGITGNPYENVYEARFNAKYDGVNAYFWTKANCRTAENMYMGPQTVPVENKRVLEIEVITEQDAEAAIEKYKAMLP